LRRDKAMDLAAGFDIGGTQIKFGLVDKKGKVFFKGSRATPRELEALGKTLENIWDEMKKRARGRKILAAGFGFPGIFSPDEEMIVQSPNFPALDGFPLRPFLEKYFDLPFYIDNDANLAAYGEWSLMSREKPGSLVFLTLGTGVGSGIILEGKIWHGQAGFAAEIGHITVNPEGERCHCGNLGCLETEVSARALVRNYLDALKKKEKTMARGITARDITLLARKGDGAARKSFERAGYFLGIGLGIIINVLNPEIIFLGGGVMAAGNLLLKPALKEARKRCFQAAFVSTKIRRARLGNDAGFIGASFFARERFESA